MTDQQSKPIILVTGGAGYIGSQLVRDLRADPSFADYTIRIYDNLQRQHFCGLMDLPADGRYEFVEGDILDRLNLGRAMHGVEIVVHLAAIVKTPLSFEHPEWTGQVNHWGTASVVDCALEADVSRLLYVSSASVYGPGGPFRETDACHPIGPYAISKLKGEGGGHTIPLHDRAIGHRLWQRARDAIRRDSQSPDLPGRSRAANGHSRQWGADPPVDPHSRRLGGHQVAPG